MVFKTLLILVKLFEKSLFDFNGFLVKKYVNLITMLKIFIIISLSSTNFFNKTFASLPSTAGKVLSLEQAVNHLHKTEFKQAQTALLKLIEKQPNSVPVLYNLGLSLYQQNKYPETQAYWRQALFIDPYNHKVRQGLKQMGDTPPFWLALPSDLIGAIQFLLWSVFIFLIYKKKFWSLSRIWLVPAIFIQVISVFYFYPRMQNYATLIQNTSLYSDSNSSAPILFEQSAGALLKIKKIKNNWSYVILSDIKEGWIPSELLIPLKNTN